MRKIIVVVSTLTLVSMLLAACAGEETSTVIPGTDVPGVTGEPTLDITEEPLETETVEPGEGTPVGGIPVTGEEDPSRLSNQLDYDIWNGEGDQIGEVNDMIVDLGNSRVSYVIVGTGGFLEIGEKDVLVPWDSLQLQTATEGDDATGDENAFILQTDQETFENAPDVDVNAILPPQGEAIDDWDIDIRNYWQSGVIPGTPSADATAVPDMTATAMPDAEGTELTALQGVVLATDLLGSDIVVGADGAVTDGQDLGTPVATAVPDATATLATDVDDTDQVTNASVDDVIVDVDTGEIQFVVLNTSFADGDRWIPVPLDRLQWDSVIGIYTLNVDQPTLEGAPFFVDGQFPDTTLEGWGVDFRNYWQ